MANCVADGHFVGNDGTCSQCGGYGLFTRLNPQAPSMPASHLAPLTPSAPVGVPMVSQPTNPANIPTGQRQSSAGSIPPAAGEQR